METGRNLSQAVPWFLHPDGSRWVSHGPGRYLSRSIGLSCALMCVNTLGSLVFSQQDFGIKSWGTGSASISEM